MPSDISLIQFRCPHCQFKCRVASFPVHCRCGARVQEDGSFVMVERVQSSSRGLGDTIAKFTRAVGIEPCSGCEERQEKLNKMFPYGTDQNE